MKLNWSVIKTIAVRTLKGYLETPSAYVVGVFFYGFVGWFFGGNYFVSNHASVESLAVIAPWVLWFIGPALTMNLISEELRTGSFEALATLPARDWEIVLGKYLGFSLCYLGLIGSLFLYPLVAALTVETGVAFDWGQALGALLGLALLGLFFGAIGLWASSMAKNLVVALILGALFCAVFFFLGQIARTLSGPLSNFLDNVGSISHVFTLSRGVFDFRDIFYFVSFSFFFLYLTALRLNARRF